MAQLNLDGQETTDPATERAARALWDRDNRRTFPDRDYPSVKAAQDARDAVWPRVRSEYLKTAETCIGAWQG